MIDFIADHAERSVARLRLIPLRRILWINLAAVALIWLPGARPSCEGEEGPPKAPQARAIDYAFERQFAERMLKSGASSLYLQNGSSGYAVRTELPDVSFHVDGIEFGSDGSEHRKEVSVSDQDLQDADRLFGVSSLVIDAGKITDTGFSKLVAGGRLRRLVLGRQSRLPPGVIQSCSGLETLELQSLKDAQPWITQAASLPSLRTLAVDYPRQSVPKVEDLHQSASLRTLRFRAATLTDDALATLAGCRNLHTLELRQCRLDLRKKPGAQRPAIDSLGCSEMIVPGGQLSRLAEWFPALSRLSFSLVECDLSGWRFLGRMTQIRDLSVTRSPMLDDDLRFLPQSLEAFTTFSVEISCEGFEKHPGLPKLERIALSQAPVTDGGLAAIVKVAPNLKHVFLSEPRITPSGVRALTKLSALEVVGLHDSQNPDACLAELRPIATLKEVRGKFSSEAKADFLKSHPNCKLP